MLDESFGTETEPEETDLDRSFCSKQEDLVLSNTTIL